MSNSNSTWMPAASRKHCMTNPAGKSTDSKDSIILRTPTASDGAALWQLVKATGELEPNTAYCYLLLATDFADTCLVAEAAGQIVGAVIGYRPPREPDAAFVWQVGVLPDYRGLGLGLRMLTAWRDLPVNRNCRWVTATVADDNPASQSLFQRLAHSAGVECTIKPHFTAELFPVAHPPEPLHRIGPFSL